jgi:homocysteine S-methyltransferase
MRGGAFPGFMVLDGGFGTELERRGASVRGSLWSAEALLGSPQLVEDVHAAYLDAGADCITTGSYQISFEGFAEAGLSAADTIQAFKASMALADAARRRAAGTSGRRLLVAASLGPYGAILHNGAEYHGRYGVPLETLVHFHRSRLGHLQNGPIDLVACETVPSIQEATAMLRALEAFPHLTAWLSFTCADERHTGSGDDIDECARLANSAPQVVAVGANCTAPQHINALVERLARKTHKPIAVYPNSGQRWDAAARAWTGESSIGDFGALAADWQSRGAAWIGGCCGTTPEHIAQVRGHCSDNRRRPARRGRGTRG